MKTMLGNRFEEMSREHLLNSSLENGTGCRDNSKRRDNMKKKSNRIHGCRRGLRRPQRSKII